MRVLTSDELVELLDRFGMKVQLDPAGAAADGVSPELVTARLASTAVTTMCIPPAALGSMSSHTVPSSPAAWARMAWRVCGAFSVGSAWRCPPMDWRPTSTVQESWNRCRRLWHSLQSTGLIQAPRQS